MTDGRLLFASCVKLCPTGERIEGSERVERGWPHDLPGVETNDSNTAYLIRTDVGVQRQYEAWLRASTEERGGDPWRRITI